MRLQPLARLTLVGLIALAGTLLISSAATAHHPQVQPGVTATAPATPSAGIPLTYTVRSGDSFNVIARRFNLTPQQLQALNAISNVNVIHVGQVLIVGISTFTPTSAPTVAPTRSATVTATPTATASRTPTPLLTRTPAAQPTLTAVRTLSSTQQATPSPTRSATARPASTAPKEIPADVIVVSILICVIVVIIIIGLRIPR
jgi:LysM repeat protein